MLGISMVLVLALGMWGCATTSDMERVQAQEKVIDAKADQPSRRRRPPRRRPMRPP